MRFFAEPLTPEQVFTPRSSEINERIYVARPELETVLKNAILGTQHVLIHGESGGGKSWLYKRVLKEMDATLGIANLANASRLGSITAELKNTYETAGEARKTGYSEEKSAEVDAVFASGSLSHESQYEVASGDPFERALATVRSRAKDATAVLVLDNLEAIFDTPNLMSELANLIILLDDERYSRHRVNLLIVGVPADVREYFNRTPSRASVANRLFELPEVARLSKDQSDQLVETGFVKLLRYNLSVDELTNLKTHVSWVTDRIPQRVHEYCLSLAKLETSGTRVGHTLMQNLDPADRAWLSSALAHAYSAVETAMNVRETKVGRRNQTLYALGLIEKNEIRLSDVEDIVRSEFPISTHGKTLNISGMLFDLSSTPPPLIKRSPRGDAWVFTDPRFRMCIRLMLRKTGEVIEKLETAEL